MKNASDVLELDDVEIIGRAIRHYQDDVGDAALYVDRNHCAVRRDGGRVRVRLADQTGTITIYNVVQRRGVGLLFVVRP